MGKPAIFLICFAVFWTVIIGVADFAVGRDAVLAVRSEAFATTTGTITSSDLARHRGDEGPTYTADIRYSYRVGGQDLAGDVYSFRAFAPSRSRWARALLARHPVGQTVPVYYDPGDPTISVLKPGLDASNLFLLLFITPFNVVMLGLWWLVGPQIWHRWHGTQPPPAPWFRDGGATHVRLPYLPSVASGFAAVGVGAFVAIFVIGFMTGFYPEMDTVITTWVVVLGFGAATGINTWLKERQGAFDLVIKDRSVELPAMYGRTARLVLDRSAISGVVIQKTEFEDSEKSTTYDVRFEQRGGAPETLVTWYDGASAERLAAWLREKLGLR